jgi:hypothetical protein
MMTAPQNDVMTSTPWIQIYDPLASPWLSTAAAAFPIVLLLVALGVLEWRAHVAALAGLVSALAVSIVIFGMPLPTATATALYGAAYGFLPIGWIILNAVFLYNLTVHTGQFEIVKLSVGRLSQDRRIQALLVAFSFGAFIEGASGFGTPVAICSALLIGLGFTPLYAAGLSLIANTAPVAFGAYARRHGRAAVAVRIIDRPRLAGGDDERLARAARRVAGRARVWRNLRNRAVRLVELRRGRARRYRRRAGLDRCGRAVRSGLAAARGMGISGGRFVRRAPKCCGATARHRGRSGER